MKSIDYLGEQGISQIVRSRHIIKHNRRCVNDSFLRLIIGNEMPTNSNFRVVTIDLGDLFFEHLVNNSRSNPIPTFFES